MIVGDHEPVELVAGAQQSDRVGRERRGHVGRGEAGDVEVTDHHPRRLLAEQLLVGAQLDAAEVVQIWRG